MQQTFKHKKLGWLFISILLINNAASIRLSSDSFQKPVGMEVWTHCELRIADVTISPGSHAFVCASQCQVLDDCAGFAYSDTSTSGQVCVLCFPRLVLETLTIETSAFPDWNLDDAYYKGNVTLWRAFSSCIAL